MIVTDRCLCVYEESGIGVCALKTTLQDILHADTQTEGIVLQPALLHYETEIAGRCSHPEIQIVTLGLNVHVRLQLPAVPETESIIHCKEEHRLCI